MADRDPVAIAVLAKAPLPGFAKTRLIPLIGAERAAGLQRRLIARAVETACASGIGPVTVWGAPDTSHDIFATLCARLPVTLKPQPEDDLGARMLAAMADAGGPALVIGTDCPALTVSHLGAAAEALDTGADVVVSPAEDGGYVLIGARQPQPALFGDMTWSTSDVMAETRRRLEQLELAWVELTTLWDVDRPEDLARLRAGGYGDLIPG